uniref:AB hydrolase-1 domain-containing protein n=1 Tax=Helicotheca tamesis TaxID=374047 RepID=A0A7S2HNH5_9STRA
MLSKLAYAAMTLAALGTASADTVLDEHFCQIYYTLDDGNCPVLRDTVRSEIRGEGTPTLELGDPTSQPALVFLHGWPDTSATWANQFAVFCGEDKEYFCVAPSITDFHPDVPLADPSDLSWIRQLEKYHAVIEELGLSGITLVSFDFGAIYGYHFVYKYPHLISRHVSMDIPMTPGSKDLAPGNVDFMYLPYYQQVNIYSYLAGDDKAMNLGINTVVGDPPCKACRIAPDAKIGAGARTGWGYYIFVKTEDPWTEDLSDIPYEQWEFDFIPSYPEDIPMLYLYSPSFLSPTFIDWIDQRGDGVSGHMLVPDADHWLSIRQPEIVNAKLAEWFSATNAHDGFNCDDKNPCDPLLMEGKYYYPYIEDEKFVRCSEHGKCYVRPCPDDEVWDRDLNTCV